MKSIKFLAVLLFAGVLLLPVAVSRRVHSQINVGVDSSFGEAPAAFDNLSNGLVPDSAHRGVDEVSFEEVEQISDGLGPVFNAQSCAACHQNPVVGGISQVTELRAGHEDSAGNFVDATTFIRDDNGNTVAIKRSLINDRAICPAVDAQQLGTDGTGFNHPNAQIQEHVADAENIRTFRTTTNVLGDGFVEAVNSNLLVSISNQQTQITGGQINGLVIQVPIGEAPGQVRVGRFGHKNQHASLLSFAGDAYVNEMGITSRLNPTDTTSVCDTVADPENVNSPTPDPVTGTNLADIDRFARFMRATKAPPRDTILAATADAQAGGQIFNQIGCGICHVPTLVTADTGTVINGGALTVPAALGHKQFHPFGDFLLHDIGTGDDIVQNGGQGSADFIRTAPLWGVRTRDRLMHDGESLTLTDAILRHQGAAAGVTQNFQNLSTTQRNQLLKFLNSL